MGYWRNKRSPTWLLNNLSGRTSWRIKAAGNGGEWNWKHFMSCISFAASNSMILGEQGNIG
jgi:hypothetical protein